MLIPVLNKESTGQELSNLCWLLNEIKASCEDSNIRWKIAQLASNVEELSESFLKDNTLWPLSVSGYHKEFSEKLTVSDRTEFLLSFAFNSVAVLDCARYEEFEPGEEFRNTVKSIRNETLHLLHEKRGWTNEEV